MKSVTLLVALSGILDVGAPSLLPKPAKDSASTQEAVEKGVAADGQIADSPFMTVAWRRKVFARRSVSSADCVCATIVAPPACLTTSTVPAYAPPKPAESLVEKANQAIDTSDHDAAIAAYQKAMEQEPAKREAYRKAIARVFASRALLLHRKRMFDEAIADYGKAIEYNPYQLISYRNRGVAFLSKGLKNEASFFSAKFEEPATETSELYTQAVADLKTVVKGNPKDAQSHYWLAYLLSTGVKGDNRDAKQAIDFATTACKLSDYKNWEYVLVLAVAQGQAGEFDAALANAERAAQTAPAERQEACRNVRSFLERRQPLP